MFNRHVIIGFSYYYYDRFVGCPSFVESSSMPKFLSQKMTKSSFKTPLITEISAVSLDLLLPGSLQITSDGDTFSDTRTTQLDTFSKRTSTSKELLMVNGNLRRLGRHATLSLIPISLTLWEDCTSTPTSTLMPSLSSITLYVKWGMHSRKNSMSMIGWTTLREGERRTNFTKCWQV